jgi:hypothetical protein
MKRFAISYVVTSESSEKLRLVKELVSDTVHLDSIHEDIGTAKDRIYVERRRLGDYFSSVQVADSGPTSFRLVFEPCPNADRYWKDLVVKVLASIRGFGLLIQHEK